MSEIRVDNITDEAGTGAPGFPNGITATGAALTDPEITGGIYLGGTGSANYLDDYEEGTWTPTVFDALSGGNSGSFDNIGNASYTKVGRQVTVCLSVNNLTDQSALTQDNDIYIALPFSASLIGLGSVTGRFNVNSEAVHCAIVVFGTQNRARILQHFGNNSNEGTIKVSAFGSPSDLQFTLTYSTDS